LNNQYSSKRPEPFDFAQGKLRAMHPERSPALLSGAQSKGRAQSKDAIPSQVLLGKRPFDCALHPSAIAQDAQGSAQGAGFSIVMD